MAGPRDTGMLGLSLLVLLTACNKGVAYEQA